MRGYSARKSIWLLLVLLIVGGLIGSLLGSLLGNVVPVLNQSFQTIGLAPTTVDLMVATITLGLQFSFNVAGIVGLLLALIIYFRL